MADDRQLIELLAQALRVLDNGGHPALQDFLDAHAEHAAALRQRLRRLYVMGLLADRDGGAVDSASGA